MNSGAGRVQGFHNGSISAVNVEQTELDDTEARPLLHPWCGANGAWRFLVRAANNFVLHTEPERLFLYSRCRRRCIVHCRPIKQDSRHEIPYFLHAGWMFNGYF